MNRNKYHRVGKCRTFKKGNSTKRRKDGDYMQNPQQDIEQPIFYPNKKRNENQDHINQSGI